MKQMSKRITTLFLSILMLLTVIPITSFAANNSVNYWEHTEPTRTLYYTGGTTLKGDDVKWFQCAINNLIINGDVNRSQLSTNKLDVDGSFGPASNTALLAFQKKYGLTQDGKFGPASRNKMKSVLRSGPTPPPQPTVDYKYYTVGPASGQISYYNSSISYFSYDSVATKMISSRTGGNGSFYFNLNVNDNDQRVGHVYAYNGSNQQIANLSITQQGTYVYAQRVTPNSSLQPAWEGGYCLSSLGGDCVRYKITSNRKVNIRIEDEKGSYLYTTVGSDQFAANTYKTNEVDVKFPNNPTNYNRHLNIAALAGNKASRPEKFYQPLQANQYNAYNSTYDLGSIIYGGYRYKIVAQEDIPVNGFTVVKNITKAKWSFNWGSFASLQLAGQDYNKMGILGMAAFLKGTEAFLSAVDKVTVKVTLYQSQSKLRYATISVYDTALQKRLNNDAGVIRTGKVEDGRAMEMFLTKDHQIPVYQYNAFLNGKGEMCVAFRDYSGDYIKIRDNKDLVWNPTWTTVPRLGYGYNYGHKSMFAAVKAPDGYKDLLVQAVNS